MTSSHSASVLVCLINLSPSSSDVSFFFFNDTATTEIYSLSLHYALPISLLFDFGLLLGFFFFCSFFSTSDFGLGYSLRLRDRKSTRLNSSHSQISYAVFCLKKKISTVYAPRPVSEVFKNLRAAISPGLQS